MDPSISHRHGKSLESLFPRPSARLWTRDNCKEETYERSNRADHGALTGIGRAAALAFAKEGASVVVSGRKEAEGKALEAELTALGANAAFIRADVRHEDEVCNLIDKTVARFGGSTSR
jgi:shikimate 5-dehydrogenase